MKSRQFIHHFVFALSLAWLSAGTYARGVAPTSPAIASAHPLATQAGYDILQRGGNAFDAAVAVASTLAVVEPYASGLGGGGFWLLHRAQDGFETMVDARETAPLKVTAAMFAESNSAPQASLEGAKSAGIPGTPAALAHIAKKYGKLPLKVSLEAAIRYAREGFTVGDRYRAVTSAKLDWLRARPDLAAAFLHNGDVPETSQLIRQPNLARSLEAIAARGADGFYKVPLAAELVQAVGTAGGVWQTKDLANYKVVERRPIKFTFLDKVTITSAAPPSSGGVTLAQLLNILEYVPIFSSDHRTRIHYLAEAMRRAYQDRAHYLGDPDFVTMPIERLLDKNYAARRALGVDPNQATPSVALDQATVPPREGNSTTHFSIIDTHGNRVAATLSINTAFGCGFIAGKTGVLLNNQLDDFALRPGAPNAEGMVGGEANALRPGKRPLSSMAPTFVEDERGVLIFGTPGGSRIISMMATAIFDFVGQAEPDVQRLVSSPRFHHQYLPDRIEFEPEGFDYVLLEQLEAMGHSVQTAQQPWGRMQAVFFDKRSGATLAASDPRDGW